MRYSTDTQSGQTNANGDFLYQPGETVSFYVGDILIGQAAGASTIMPFDLAGIAPPQSGVEISQAVNLMDILERATPFEVAINIAVFLQTIDEDGELSNGIQVPDQLHNLASGISLDFEQKVFDFYDDTSLRKLLASGRSAGLWGGSRAIRNFLYALDTLYSGLKLTPAIYTISIKETESNADGTADYRETDTYTASNRWIVLLFECE